MIHFELAKNGELTCFTYKMEDKKYIYSKYNPGRVVFNENIDLDKEGYIVLGVGLGYEVKNLLSSTDKIVYLIEALDVFIDKWSFSQKELSRIEVIRDISEAKKIITNTKYQLIINKKICELSLNYYKSILQPVSLKKTVICIEHAIYMERIVLILERKGYDVIYVKENEINTLGVINRPLFIFSLNFSPYLCDIAKVMNIIYISWIIDIPNYYLYLNEGYLNYSKLWVFHFDKSYMEDLKGIGKCKIEYLPLAADLSIQKNFDSNVNYIYDISFVGALTSFNELNKSGISNISPGLKKKINDLIKIQSKEPMFVLDKILTEEIVNHLTLELGNWEAETYELIDRKLVWAVLIARYMSYLQRAKIIKCLAKSPYDFKLFGANEWTTLQDKDVNNSLQKVVSYFPESFNVFRQSKININDTRPYFKDAVPLRLYDILGVRGFVVTNSHQSLKDMFVDGRDLVVYRDEQDLMEIIDYYLIHEKERQEIATQGYQNVKNNHNLESRIQIILEKVLSSE